ncbi:MAG TPA: hypothetical protein RMH99_22420 [Sandaracinaceae bacterium LLY-WYZ-13_1]|nr:hypothetical protein [Sandaracinaceae bacterium LLY-WYZ-13_1]
MAVNDHQRLEFSAALRSNLEQLANLHDIVAERIERQKAVEEALESAVKRVEEEKSQEGDALKALSEASEDAVRRARLVGVKLEAAFLEGQVTEEVYRAALNAAFPNGPQSIGTTPQQRLEALRRIATALSQHDAADPSGELGPLAQGGAQAIEDANAQAKREQADAQEANDSLAAARHDFDEGYQATKEIVAGLLRDAKRLNELKDVFPDM